MIASNDMTTSESLENPHDATRFLATIFNKEDRILFRPIETWIEDGKKRSRAIESSTLTVPWEQLPQTVRNMLVVSSNNRANVFFGVCPRRGLSGEYDMAWQIKTVRMLWADVDHTTPDELFDRINLSGLPRPTITVNSGNGCHVYWLLTEPYIIDDGRSEKVSGKGDKKHIVVEGEKLFLKSNKVLSELSLKAIHAQNVLAGVASHIGGDKTHDLSRILRVPGTINRKYTKGEPIILKPCTIVEFGTNRYDFKDFEKFAAEHPSCARQRAIKETGLPKVKKITDKGADKLTEQINRCVAAEIGTRSECDFSLCCYAIKHGISRDHLWSEVQGKGKFAEGGERYFDYTWNNAEYAVRFDTYESSRPKSEDDSFDAEISFGGIHVDESTPEEPSKDRVRYSVAIDSSLSIKTVFSSITNVMRQSGIVFNRAGQLTRATRRLSSGFAVTQIQDVNELLGLTSELSEFTKTVVTKDREIKSYHILPLSLASAYLRNADELEKLKPIDIVIKNPVYDLDWQLCSSGYNESSRIFMACDEVEPIAGTSNLDDLISEFNFKSNADRTSCIGLMLTYITMPHFIKPGKPLALFAGTESGLGKTFSARMIATIMSSETQSEIGFKDDENEFEKTIASKIRDEESSLIIDNIAAKNGNIASPVLDRVITSEMISVRLLGTNTLIKRENSILTIATLNTATISRDLITRSCIVNFDTREDADGNRIEFKNDQPVEKAVRLRKLVQAELVNMVKVWIDCGMPKDPSQHKHRFQHWASVIGGILSCNGYTDFVPNQSSDIAQDGNESDFIDLLTILANERNRTNLTREWSNEELAHICVNHYLFKERFAGATNSRSRSTRFGFVRKRFEGREFELEGLGKWKMESAGKESRGSVVHRTDPPSEDQPQGFQGVFSL